MPSVAREVQNGQELSLAVLHRIRHFSGRTSPQAKPVCRHVRSNGPRRAPT